MGDTIQLITDLLHTAVISNKLGCDILYCRLSYMYVYMKFYLDAA